MAARDLRWHYEGIWGQPERWWRWLGAHVPALRWLDFLPRYTFVGGGAVLVLYLLYLLFTFDIEPPVSEAALAAAARGLESKRD